MKAEGSLHRENKLLESIRKLTVSMHFTAFRESLVALSIVIVHSLLIKDTRIFCIMDTSRNNM